MLESHLSWWMLPPAVWTAFCIWLVWLDGQEGRFRGESATFFIVCAVIGNALMLATRFLP
jgi:hypothetical protein